MHKSMLVLAALLISACGVISKTEVQVQQAKAKWNQQKISSYRFTYTGGGFAPKLRTLVTVREGAVVAAVTLDDNQPIAAEQLSSQPTVATLFAEIERRMPGGKRTTATFDAQLGYPSHAYFDGGEEGDGFDVSDFAIDTTPTCGGNEHACTCATGWYCLFAGGACLDPATACPQ